MVTSRFLFFVSVTVAAASASVLGVILPSQSAVSFSEREENKKFKYEWKLPKSRKWLKLNDESIDDKMHGERRVMPWVSITVLLIFLFSFRSFAAPFFDPLGEPRQSSGSTIYFFLIAVLYLWLTMVTTLTVLPHVSTHYNVIIAMALFFYMTTVSICALLMGRLMIRCGYYLWLLWYFGENGTFAIYQKISKVLGFSSSFRKSSRLEIFFQKNNAYPDLFAFHRPFRRVFKCAITVAASLCILYAHCWSRSLSAFKTSSEDGASVICKGIFLPLLFLFGSSKNENCRDNVSCADEAFIWKLWGGTVFGHLFYYAIHEFTGKHHRGYRPPSRKRKSTVKKEHQCREGKLFDSSDDLRDIDVTKNSSLDDDEADNHDFREFHDDCGVDETNGSVSRKDKDYWASLTATIQKISMRVERPQDTEPMVPWYNLMMFSSGFDILVSLHIFLGRFDARKMQLALLGNKKKVYRGGDDTMSDPLNSEGVFDFSTTNNHSNSSTTGDEGFWFDFMSDCGDGFNSSYQISRLLAQPELIVRSRNQLKNLPRGRILVIGDDLAYPDPTPENYEKRFFRTFEDAMPPPPSFRKEHISIQKPALPVKGWENKGSNSKRETGTLESYDGPCAFTIPGNHDWFDGLATYTRYILSRDWLGGWLMPQRTSYFATKLPRGWWIFGLDLALDNDINIEQFEFFVKLAERSMQPEDAVIIVTHVPSWVLSDYEKHSVESLPETNLRELMRTHLNGKVKLRLAGDLHHYTRHMPTDCLDKPTLIVSGGGGAFSHPTHCFRDRIQVGDEKDNYERVCAYPSTKVSRHLSYLNLWQFRWRNWRFDVLWAICYFGISTSFFPLCGVYDDYLEYNPDHRPLNLVTFVASRVATLLSQLFISGRLSLVFSFVVIILTYLFTDWSNVKTSTHLCWSLLHALTHICTALTCLLFVECMAEFVVSEGLVAVPRTNVDVPNQSCLGGLASSIFDEYTTHFSHTLDDFPFLNATNSTFFAEPPGLFPSCRFDERLYERVSNTLRWMQEEAPLLKTALAIFDLPGTIGLAHVQMCEKLCSDGAYCTYSNDFMKYQQIDRVTILKYLAAISFYFVVFAVPIAGHAFGTWLALTLNVLNSQYNEGFSSLRLEHWKNFLRMHVDENGDLEIFSIGLHRVPKKWVKDPLWSGNNFENIKKTTTPSWSWKRPSMWIPERNSKKFIPLVVDHTKLKRVNG